MKASFRRNKKAYHIEDFEYIKYDDKGNIIKSISYHQKIDDGDKNE